MLSKMLQKIPPMLGGAEEGHYTITKFHWWIRCSNWITVSSWICLIYTVVNCFGALLGYGPVSELPDPNFIPICLVGISVPTIVTICIGMGRQLFVGEKEALICTLLLSCPLICGVLLVVTS